MFIGPPSVLIPIVFFPLLTHKMALHSFYLKKKGWKFMSYKYLLNYQGKMFKIKH